MTWFEKNSASSFKSSFLYQHVIQQLKHLSKFQQSVGNNKGVAIAKVIRVRKEELISVSSLRFLGWNCETGSENF